MPSLEEIMGSSYREDMTADDVNAFFKSQLLATGEYESKSKVDAERRKSEETIKGLQTKIQGSMTDDELRAQETEALKAEIEALKADQKASKLETAQLKAKSSLAEAQVLMGITHDDKDFKKFVNDISAEDSNKTESIGKYINKLVKDAYEKGKSEATKKNLGEMGKQYTGGSTDEEVSSKDVELVKKMQASKPKQREFKKSNFI